MRAVVPQTPTVRRFLLATAASLVIVLQVGGGVAAARGPVPGQASPVTLPARGTLHVSNAELGPVLVDRHGRTLYRA